MPPKFGSKGGGAVGKKGSGGKAGVSGLDSASGGRPHKPRGDGKTRDRERSKGWVEMKDVDVKRRERQLAQVQAHIKDLNHSGEYGLMATVGPMLGFLDETYAVSVDGDVLGRADKMAPPKDHPKDTRVLEVDPRLAARVGYPDFPEVRYGLVSPGGDVFAAALQANGSLKELVYPPVQKNTGVSGPHPKAGQTKVIGRIALREPSTERACRVLVMGGRAGSRNDFLRWFGDVEDFEFDLARQKNEEEADKLKKQLQHEDGAKKEAVADAIEALAASRWDLDMGFKVIGTFEDTAREDELASLRQQLADKDKEEGEEVGSVSGSLGRGGTMRSISEGSSGGGDEESDAHKEAKEEREKMASKIQRFRHTQGSHTPVSKVVEQACGKALPKDWASLDKKEALCVLYHGVKAPSPLSNYGTFTDFTKHVSSKIKATRPLADPASFFHAEILLSASTKGNAALKRPPGSLLLINAPDIVRVRSGKVGEEDTVAALRERLQPRFKELMAAMQRFDEDGTNSVELLEFQKALESLALEPPIPRQDVSALFSRLDPDGGGSIEYEDLGILLDEGEDSRPCPYDQGQAFELVADIADVIVLLLDSKSSRFNPTELGIIKTVHAKHREKMHFACIDSHEQRDALARVLSATLEDRSLEAVPCVSTESTQALALVDQAVNPQQNRVVSLLAGLRSNLDAIHKRLDRIYTRLGDKQSLVVLDPSAVASGNQLVIRACAKASRRVSKESGRLLLDLKAACKKHQKLFQSLLARSNIRPLTYEDRVEQWRKEKEESDAAERAVREFDVVAWTSRRHVRAWLESVGVDNFTRDIFEREGVCGIHDLLRVTEVRMVSAGLDKVRSSFAERRRAYLGEGLWRLLQTEAPNNQEVTVKISPDSLQDQGPDLPIKPVGLKAGQRAVVDVATHGRRVILVPQRAELEAKNWELKLKRMEGLEAYISPYDLSVMIAVLKGDVECSSSSRAMLEDALHLFLVGDVPAQLVAEAVADLRLEFEDVLGHQGVEGGLPEESRAYQRRWKLEEMAAEAAGGSDVDSSSSDEEELSNTEIVQRASERLTKCFEAASGGEVVARGEAIEESVRRDQRLLKLLERAGTDMKLGGVKIFREEDILKSELMRALLGSWEGSSAGSRRSSASD